MVFFLFRSLGAEGNARTSDSPDHQVLHSEDLFGFIVTTVELDQEICNELRARMEGRGDTAQRKQWLRCIGCTCSWREQRVHLESVWLGMACVMPVCPAMRMRRTLFWGVRRFFLHLIVNWNNWKLATTLEGPAEQVRTLAECCWSWMRRAGSVSPMSAEKHGKQWRGSLNVGLT